MREIKFRYILEKDGQLKICFIDLDRLERSNELYNLFVQGYKIKDRNLWTGLKDKNGKEIYEGDIVTTDVFQSLDGEMVECRFNVEWKDCGMWGLGNKGKITTFILSEVEMWRVIGNIYENKELLEVSQ